MPNSIGSVTLPASPITPEARTLRTYLRSVFGEVGENYFFLEPASFVAGKNIFFGDNVFLNANVAPIHIGDHAMIAPGCVLMTVDHPKPATARFLGMLNSAMLSACESISSTMPSKPALTTLSPRSIRTNSTGPCRW